MFSPVIWTSSSSSTHAKGGFSLSVSRDSRCSFFSSSSYCCSLLGGTLAYAGEVLDDPVADEVAEMLLAAPASCLFFDFLFCFLPGPLPLSLLGHVIRQATGGMLLAPLGTSAKRMPWYREITEWINMALLVNLLRSSFGSVPSSSPTALRLPMQRLCSN